MCIAIIYLPGCEINLKINFIFQVKPFFYMAKKSRQIFNQSDDLKGAINPLMSGGNKMVTHT